MKLRILSPIIVLSLLMGLLAGCTTSRQADSPSAPPAAEATVAAQPVLTAVTAGSTDTYYDHQNDEIQNPCTGCGGYDCDGGIYCGNQTHESANPCVQESGKDHNPCSSCGRSDCSGGASCAGQSTHCPEEDHHGGHHDRHH